MKSNKTILLVLFIIFVNTLYSQSVEVDLAEYNLKSKYLHKQIDYLVDLYPVLNDSIILFRLDRASDSMFYITIDVISNNDISGLIGYYKYRNHTIFIDTNGYKVPLNDFFELSTKKKHFEFIIDNDDVDADEISFCPGYFDGWFDIYFNKTIYFMFLNSFYFYEIKENLEYNKNNIIDIDTNLLIIDKIYLDTNEFDKIYFRYSIDTLGYVSDIGFTNKANKKFYYLVDNLYNYKFTNTITNFGQNIGIIKYNKHKSMITINLQYIDKIKIIDMFDFSE